MKRTLLAAIGVLLLTAASCQAATQSSKPSVSMPEAMEAPDGVDMPTAQVTPEALVTVAPIQDKGTSSAQCPNLDPILVGLYTATNPTEYAESHNLMLRDEGVGVEIRLKNANADLSAYKVTVRNKRGTILEAYVPPEHLCSLANNLDILRVSQLRIVSSP
jgi:hypothetical protein